jgi:acetyl esterase/lipase
MKTKFVFLILLFSFLVSCDSKNDSNSEVTPTSLVAETKLNVSYGANNQQVFDLYLPANRTETKTKTLILVHGGGWTEGDKANMNYAVDIIKQYLPEYAIANINYRLATSSLPAFPMQINDIQSIVAKLKNENYGISDEFGFIGVSAGAHLSLLYSYAYDTDKNLKMVCSIVGPTNFNDINYANNPAWTAFYFAISGQSYAGNESYFQQLSPLFRATSSSPPTLMLYGASDSLIPVTQGQDLHAKLNQLGVYNEFKLYQGGHGDWALPDLYDAYTVRLVNFVKSKL